MAFKVGDDIRVVAGSYKGMFGMYLGPAGTKGLSGRVALRGDTQQERTLHLTSLRKTNQGQQPPTITIPMDKYEQLVEDLEELSYQLRELKLRVYNFKDRNNA